GVAAGIRTRARPVPDLAVDDDWCESPLWILRKGCRERRRLFVRDFAGKLEISDRNETLVRVNSASASNPGSLAAAVQNARISIRPRALITTMYARLVLSDLFIHGIGGAKYDEVTDEIIRRFFGIEPPKYLT